MLISRNRNIKKLIYSGTNAVSLILIFSNFIPSVFKQFMSYFQAMPYIRLSLLMATTIFLSPFIAKVRLKSLKVPYENHLLMLVWTGLVFLSLIIGLMNLNISVYYVTDFLYIFIGAAIYIAINQTNFNVSFYKIKELLLVIYTIDFIVSITPSIYLILLSMSFLFDKNYNLLNYKSLLNVFFIVKYTLDINRTIFILAITILLLIIFKKILIKASGYLFIIFFGMPLVLIFFYDFVLEQIIFFISEDSRIGIRLRQLLDFIQGNIEYNSPYFISITQRIEEAQLVLLSWTSSIASFLFGEGSGATVDGSNFMDKGVLESSLTGSRRIHNIHILPFSLILRYGLCGLILFFLLIRKSIRFFYKYFFTTQLTIGGHKTICLAYVCLLILYSIPAASTLWADQLIFVFLAMAVRTQKIVV